MIDLCPHCHERVFFTKSVCPGCGKDRHEAAAVTASAEPVRQAKDAPAANRAAFWGALALAVLAAWSFAADWAMVAKSGSIDYRNRVTGLRLLMEGQDPYHYKWSMGKPERFLDPYENPALPITKTTVTPTSLLAGWPLALAPYPVAKTLWFLAQWGLLAGLWLLWFRWHGQTTRSRWLWSALIVGFTYTLAWRHHLDRGQAYILWVFILGIWMRLSIGENPKKRGWLPGFLAGLLVCLRPPLLLVILPFVALRRRNQWLGAILGLVLGLGLPILTKPDVWQEYGRAMTTWSDVYRGKGEPRPGARALPAEVEGMPIRDLAVYRVVQYVDSSLFRLSRAWGWKDVPAIGMLASLGILFLAWLWPARHVGDTALLLGLSAWSFLLDAFLPAYRNPYTDIMILNTLALIPAITGMRKTSYCLAISATVLGVYMVSTLPPAPWLILLPTLAMAALALLSLWRSATGNCANSPSQC